MTHAPSARKMPFQNQLLTEPISDPEEGIAADNPLVRPFPIPDIESAVSLAGATKVELAIGWVDAEAGSTASSAGKMDMKGLGSIKTGLGRMQNRRGKNKYNPKARQVKIWRQKPPNFPKNQRREMGAWLVRAPLRLQ
jgi:hypothetical protein